MDSSDPLHSITGYGGVSVPSQYRTQNIHVSLSSCDRYMVYIVYHYDCPSVSMHRVNNLHLNYLYCWLVVSVVMVTIQLSVISLLRLMLVLSQLGSVMGNNQAFQNREIYVYAEFHSETLQKIPTNSFSSVHQRYVIWLWLV